MTHTPESLISKANLLRLQAKSMAKKKPILADRKIIEAQKLEAEAARMRQS